MCCISKEKIILLAKDICARIPYGLICRNEIKNCDVRMDCTRCTSHSFQEYAVFGYDRLHQYKGEELRYIKPYLRRMTDLTEEELSSYQAARNGKFGEDIDWILENHVDYRGLIPMGLAIAVTEENNPYKKDY